jgi:hypothetical protein
VATASVKGAVKDALKKKKIKRLENNDSKESEEPSSTPEGGAQAIKKQESLNLVLNQLGELMDYADQQD